MSRTKIIIASVLGVALLGGCTKAPESSPSLASVRIAEPELAPAADPGQAARHYALTRRAALGLTALDDLDVSSVEQGIDGLNHVRLQQRNHGFPVWGGDVVVHIQPNGLVSSLDGNLLQSASTFAATSTITAADALSIGEAQYSAAAAPGAALQFLRDHETQVVFNGPAGPVLAWHVEFFTEMQAGLRPARWHFFIDAATGGILQSYDGLADLSQASGPGGNLRVARSWVNQLDVEPTTPAGAYMMDTATLQTRDMAHASSGPGTIVNGPLSPISDAATDDAHGFAEILLGMLQGYGYNSIDGLGMKLVSRVHYGNGYDDAFWSGADVTYGDGSVTYYPLSGAIDIVGHELLHGFTEKHSALQTVGVTGAIEESFADIGGALAEFYYSPSTADFNVAEDVRIAGGATRFMCDPGLDGNSSDDALVYAPVADRHFNGGITNRAFCHAAKRLSSGSPTGAATAAGVQRAGAAWLLADASYWVSTTDFTQSCQGVHDAGVALGYTAVETSALRDSFADVGIYCAGGVRPCDEVLTAASGTIQSPNFPANYPDNYTHTWCIQPASGVPTLTFSAFNIDNGYDWVDIRDAANNRLSLSTGTATPPPVTTSMIRVTFASDPGIQGPGWQASWTAPDVTAPVVSITSPAGGSTVSGTVSITASASDNVGVTKVEFYNGATLIGTSLAAPFSTSWNTTTVPNGSASLSAKAYDAANNVGSSAVVTVTVNNVPPDTTAPTVSLSGPAANSFVRGVANLSATASDNVGVTRVDFYAGPILIASRTTAPYSTGWNSATVADGSYVLVARAYDAAGNFGTSNTIPVIVDNSNVSVAFTSPANGSTVSGTVNVAVNATPSYGSITNVAFYVDGVLRVTSTTAPFSMSLNTTSLSNASHTIQAIATDTAGVTGSATVSVTVNNAAGDTVKPTVSLTSPIAGAKLGWLVRLTASASDNVGVTRVEFYDGSTLLGSKTAAPWTFDWDTTALPTSTRTLSVRAYDAAGNVGTSASVSVSVKEIVANGGFESGSTSWTLSGAAAVVSSGMHSGAKVLKLGGANGATDKAVQKVTLPTGTMADPSGRTPVLTFWLNVTTSETTTTARNDNFSLQIRQEDDTLVRTMTYSNLTRSGYQQIPLDLSGLAGKTVKIVISGTTNSSLPTTFFVDDVSVR